MRIAIIQFYYPPTPAYINVARFLRLKGHMVYLADCTKEKNLVWNFEKQKIIQKGPINFSDWILKIPIASIFLRRIAYIGFIFRISRFLRNNRMDIVHINVAGFHLLWLIPLLIPKKMKSILYFGQVNRRTGLTGWFSNIEMAMTSRLFDRSCLESVVGAEEVFGKNWKKLASIVPAGVDSYFLDYPSKRNYGSKGPVRFVYLGSIAQIRKLELIILAAKRMLNITSNFQIDFIGYDKSNGYYSKLIKKLNVGSVVKMKEPIKYKDVPRIISDYDVALGHVPEKPADWKYYPPLKVLEYKALGIPILATDLKPNRKIVENGVNGLLVSNSVENLANAMLRFVNDRKFLRECKKNAQSKRDGTTWQEVADMYERVYQEALSS